jgi:hypothetical protein
VHAHPRACCAINGGKLGSCCNATKPKLIKALLVLGAGHLLRSWRLAINGFEVDAARPMRSAAWMRFEARA